MSEPTAVVVLSRDWRIVWQEHAEATCLVSVCRRFRCTVFQRTECDPVGVAFEWFVFSTNDVKFLMDSRAPSLAAAMANCEAFCRGAAAGGAAEGTA